MSDTTNSNDLAALQADMTALKRDVASLVQHLATGASKSAQDAAAQIDDGARRLYRTAAAEGDRSIKAISAQVEAQPVAALLIAVGLGYLGGRLLTR